MDTNEEPRERQVSVYPGGLPWQCNPPQGPSDIFRTTTMASAVMMARDREKAHNDLDERDQDRIAQARIEDEHQAYLNNPDERGPLRRLLDRLTFR